MNYIAHFKFDKLLNPIIQSVKNHLDSVCELSLRYSYGMKIDNIVSLIAMLHDMGKYSDAFQSYISEAQRMTREGQYDNWILSVEKPDHGVYGALFVNKYLKNNNNMNDLLADIMSMVICYHHGGMNDCCDGFDIPIQDRYQKVNTDYFEEVIKRFQQDNVGFNINEVFNKACMEFNTIFVKISGFDNNKFILHLFIKLLYSILIDADRTDTCNFMCDISTDDNILDDKINKFIDELENKLCAFKTQNELSKNINRINNIRTSIADQCLNGSVRPIGIYTLTVPTGGGKTLSSLRFALNHAKLNKLRRIIYILPYTTIIEQNADTVRKIIDKENKNVLEYHSNIINQQSDDEEMDMLVERWNYPIVFTTVVQYLNIFYGKGTKSLRRLNQIADSVIIFDEVQKIPTKCMYLFNQSINFLNKICGCSILLCTATQPELNNMDIPVMLSDHSELIHNISEISSALKRIDVVDNTKLIKEEACNFIIELYNSNKSVLVVTNTIKSALETYKTICDNTDKNNIYYLSTHLCPAQRKDIIYEVKARLRKKEKIICISTQLIEAGVDISFDTVVRDLCGLDSIIQASGRANRNGECEIGQSYIIDLKDENITRLKEISLGQKIMKILLNDKIKDPEIDLISDSEIKKYFNLFYKDIDIKNEMKYQVNKDKHDESIYDMLSLNSGRNKLYEQKYGENIPILINYRFKTASENFNVIDNNTDSVIVPYKDEGKDIISKLTVGCSLNDKIKLLKAAQMYSINLFEDKFNKLKEEGAIISCDIKGVYYLNEDWFDDKTGLLSEKKLKFCCL